MWLVAASPIHNLILSDMLKNFRNWGSFVKLWRRLKTSRGVGEKIEAAYAIAEGDRGAALESHLLFGLFKAGRVVKGGGVFVARLCIVCTSNPFLIMPESLIRCYKLNSRREGPASKSSHGGALINVKYFTEANAAASSISEMIYRVPNIGSDDKQGKILSDVEGDLEIKYIDVAYPSKAESVVLRNFNLGDGLMASQTVGLVGKSGSGKSTVINLLERFYDPLTGEILLDGVDIKSLQVKWLRSQMGIASQEPINFATSIKENILFGKEEASMEEVISAAKAANAHNFINQLPNGYDTWVSLNPSKCLLPYYALMLPYNLNLYHLPVLYGQLGIQMSQEQKQRISISRALLRGPKLRLHDEATSALDSHSEKLRHLMGNDGPQVEAVTTRLRWWSMRWIDSASHYYFGIMGGRLTTRVRKTLFGKILTFEVEWFDQEDSGGAICARLATDVTRVKTLVADYLSLLAQNVSSAILAVVLGLVLSWRLALVAIYMQPLIIRVFYTKAIMMKMSEKVVKAQSKSSGLAIPDGSQCSPNLLEAGHQTTIGASALKMVLMILKRNIKMDPDDSDGINPEKIERNIEFKEVDFFYPTRPRQMFLKHLNLKVDTGKVVALVGTIHDIIPYGMENAFEAEIIGTATIANAHDFISGSMKDGYATYCGETVVQLSGGQKQRIALARAILQCPATLPLDEAASALDFNSENLVQNALEKTMVGRTCVAVAHRLSTVQKSNKITVIENGRRIIELTVSFLPKEKRVHISHL
ncbi:ABC transporter B family member 15 [Citrus sinensis]|uniref:ABC transporter B family member 15 n=1 Tax=Citrus sinensis TaxID=2711 RepID=A0ACB8P6E1_CITSI|nr:ABC transporter B family member 15 [Citrus sinensis]